MCFLKTVPSATCYSGIDIYVTLYTEGTVFIKLAVVEGKKVLYSPFSPIYSHKYVFCKKNILSFLYSISRQNIKINLYMNF